MDLSNKESSLSNYQARTNYQSDNDGPIIHWYWIMCLTEQPLGFAKTIKLLSLGFYEPEAEKNKSNH